ncbi:MAG TPA: DUF2007 domain-containing protein [Roseimicrobium sp.]|nr:DUF2007 domain-containing protein [Roseimicrobium sp.]
MTTIANCFDLNEAEGLRMMLDAAGIPSFIPDEVSAGVAPYNFVNQTGVRLQVDEEHVEEAKRLIAEQKPAGS